MVAVTLQWEATHVLCPYCFRDKPSGEFTDEHFLTKHLGGRLEPTNPFIIRTCRSCNNACGRWVDAPFTKSVLLTNHRALAARRFADFSRQPTLPLVFLGRLDGTAPGELSCDVWLGPAGDGVFHFHEPYDASPTLVGRPPHLPARNIDPGVVLVLVVATNPIWQRVTQRSVRAEFEDASIYFAGRSSEGRIAVLPPCPDRVQDLAGWVEEIRPDDARKIRSSFDIDCGDRFLAKVALGLGVRFLDEQYVASADAADLRAALWARDSAVWPDAIKGRDFFQDADPVLKRILTWRDCDSLLIQPHRSGVGLMLSVHGEFVGSMVIASYEGAWRGRIDENGTIFVLAPALRRFAGPMTVLEYLMAKEKGTGLLADLNRRLDALPPQPPLHLPDASRSPR